MPNSSAATYSVDCTEQCTNEPELYTNHVVNKCCKKIFRRTFLFCLIAVSVSHLNVSILFPLCKLMWQIKMETKLKRWFDSIHDEQLSLMRNLHLIVGRVVSTCASRIFISIYCVHLLWYRGWWRTCRSKYLPIYSWCITALDLSENILSKFWYFRVFFFNSKSNVTFYPKWNSKLIYTPRNRTSTVFFFKLVLNICITQKCFMIGKLLFQRRNSNEKCWKIKTSEQKAIWIWIHTKKLLHV